MLIYKRDAAIRDAVSWAAERREYKLRELRAEFKRIKQLMTKPPNDSKKRTLTGET
jgi:hypothetical protein